MKVSLKVRNQIQIHILHLLETEPSVELFTVLATAWEVEGMKALVKEAYKQAHIINKRHIC